MTSNIWQALPRGESGGEVIARQGVARRAEHTPHGGERPRGLGEHRAAGAGRAFGGVLDGRHCNRGGGLDGCSGVDWRAHGDVDGVAHVGQRGGREPGAYNRPLLSSNQAVLVEEPFRGQFVTSYDPYCGQ